ncbi:LytR/AlgR family response regulator transcription factor [Pedobacter lithocola]|uniref:LytR/AlgR family response regulator transcription factor n=1 Tax=Pedobacter lithocola TaxID=1908239 RepID=A0ABV8PBM6_9SPHI
MNKSQKQYSCAIIDDEFSTIRLMSEYIAMVPKLQLVSSYLDPRTGVKEIKQLPKLDFLFLDINMAVSGIDVGMALRDYVRFMIIITGHPEHAMQAFKIQADNFLLKPLRFEKFLWAINKSITSINSIN